MAKTPKTKQDYIVLLAVLQSEKAAIEQSLVAKAAEIDECIRQLNNAN